MYSGRRFGPPRGRYYGSLMGNALSVPSTVSELNQKIYSHIEEWRQSPH